MKALWQKAYLLLILIGGMIFPPHQAVAEETPDMAMVIANVIAGHEGLSELFSDAAINTTGTNKASVFASNGPTRYALVVIPLRNEVKAKEVSEPFCRSRLMTPEADAITANLYAKTDDDMVISTLMKLWQSQGALNSSEATTSIFDKDGYAMTLCKVDNSGVTTGFVKVDADLLGQAEMMIARRLYDGGDADLLQQRMEDFYSETQRPDAGAYLALAFWLKGEYEAGFAIDETLDASNISDTWLKQQYDMRFDEAVETYFNAALKNSQSDN